MKGKERIIIAIAIGIALFLGVQLGMTLSNNVFVVLGMALLIGLIVRISSQIIIKKMK